MPTINRDIAETIKAESKKCSVLVLLGPMQIGKTTLLRAMFPNCAYADLDQAELRTLAISNADQFFARFPLPVIIDGIQQAPSFEHAIQAKMVQNPTLKGQVIVAGRYRPQKKDSPISGGVIYLLPLSIKEIKKSFPNSKWDPNALILKGGMPMFYGDEQGQNQGYGAYCTKFIKQHVQGVAIVNEGLFERFMKACAARVGQPVNANAIAKELGISVENTEEWIGILEGSFIIFKLMPIEDSWGKKISKSAKLYFVDVGLASYLLGLKSTDQLTKSPQYDRLYENLIINEIVKEFHLQMKQPQVFYYKDAKGMEVDLLVKNKDGLMAIDISPTAILPSDAINALESFAKSIPVTRSYLIYNGESHSIKDKIDTLHFADSSNILQA